MHEIEALHLGTAAWSLVESRLSPLLRTGQIFIITLAGQPAASSVEALGVELATRCVPLELDVVVLPGSLGALSLAIREGLESMSLLSAALQRLVLATAPEPLDIRATEAARMLLRDEDDVEVDRTGAVALVEAIRLVREASPRRPRRVAVVLRLAAPAGGTIQASH
jgi:hypothetical protein